MEGIGGNRLTWAHVPAQVRTAIEDGLGSAVVREVSCPGGFSPGLASKLELADGRRVFAKAVGTSANPHSPTMHRREAEVSAVVPGPRLLWSYDDGDWVALVFEEIAGRGPALPWVAHEWERVHAAVVELGSIEAPDGFRSIGADPGAFSGWRSLAAEPLPGIDPWALERLDELAAWESEWAAAAAGRSLVHGDLRADNVLLTSSDVVFVDWPQAGWGSGFGWTGVGLCLRTGDLEGMV
ncbi:phosphotransferase [Saccharothrix deserti]|uniref:phosphotransferase n=1 Tax=Saccharothrix deserti TaxID=2593674 RepID=UPI00131E4954|nr:phosphotransferase [Saccharothrix deserti]